MKKYLFLIIGIAICIAGCGLLADALSLYVGLRTDYSILLVPFAMIALGVYTTVRSMIAIWGKP